ncbi:reverse transcriptase domain-containing protein [Tanacetum coccineum]
MTGPTSDPVTPLNQFTKSNDNQDNSPTLQDQILSHMSSLETFIRQHNERAGTPITPIRLTFTEEGEFNKGKDNNKGLDGEKDEDLKRPYKEVLKSPFTRRIIEFSAPNHRKPANLKIYARPFADQVPQTVTEMMKMVNDFVKSEEAYKSTKLPKREHSEKGQGTSYKGNRPPCSGYRSGYQRTDNYGCWDHYQPCVPPRAHDPRYDSRRYCDYHGEKGHYTNDCYQLKRQLEAALESGKLSNLVKDVRQRGNNKGRQLGNNNSRGKVIIMIREIDDSRKENPGAARGKSGQIVFVDHGAAVQVMFKYCFDNLSPAIKARLTPAQTELVGFSGEQLIPIRKVELKVTFGGGGLSRTVMLKFTVVRASSSYNIILGRTGMRELKVVSSIVHAMVKFPTPRGIVTLIARTAPVYKCRWSKKKVEHDEKVEEMEPEKPKETGEEKLSSDERSVRMGEGQNRKTGEVSNMDLQSGVGKKDAVRIKERGATYQRLVDSAFQKQLGRNLEAYVDDMVIKSKTEQEMIVDIAETFDNLRKVNMKLNPKKCSFGVNEGKFLGCMVTSEGIRANPKKTKAVADMQSPKTLKEMQSLSGKLASLNRFLSRFAERALSFFETLKKITKENMDDYRWT